MRFIHLYSLACKYPVPKGAAKKGQDVQHHRRGMGAKAPEKVKTRQFLRNKQLISLNLKQNIYIFYHQPVLSRTIIQ